jgi:hypothetical protein
MYAPEICERNIEKAAESVGFTPERYSVDTVAAAVDHLNGLIGEDGKLTRALEKDERQFIENERLICQHDFAYWAARYGFIRDWEANLSRFQPNIAQLIYLDILAEQEREQRALANLLLKARQLGMSTINELIVEHRAQFHPHTVAVVASCDPEKSEKMAEMVDRCFDAQPWFLKPTVTSRITGNQIEFGQMDSRIYLQHGSQKRGMGRGSSPNIAHLSEVSSYLNPDDDIDASLIRAMHESPRMFLALESTALARYDWWHRTWLDAQENYPRRRSKMRPTFLPWFVGRDLYPTETWLRARPIPADWIPAETTQKHAERAAAYVRVEPILRKHLGAGWQMPREQMWFYELERDTYARKGNLGKFLAEMPGSADEAFQSANRSVFDTTVITSIRENTKKEPLGVFGIVGPDSLIAPRHKPMKRDIDPDRSSIKVSEDFTLVPLRFTGYSGTDPTNKLFIWVPPEDEFEFGAGIDTGKGLGQDRSVVQILRKGTLERNDEQCAEFASPYLNALELAPFAYAVLKLYSVKLNGQYRQAKAVIETGGAGSGENTQFQLRKMGWTNFHQVARIDRKRIRTDRVNALGWHTSEWSRKLLIDHLLTMINDGTLDINSPWLVDELSDLELDETRLRVQAAQGAHDDRVLAIGMILTSLHQLELRGGAVNISAQRRASQTEEESYPRYSPSWGEAPVRELDLEEEYS